MSRGPTYGLCEPLASPRPGGAGPRVMLNRRVRGVRSFVTVDDAAGAAMATRHLAELGHSEVAGIFGPGAIDTTVRRLAGFEEAGRQAKIRLTRNLAGDHDLRAGGDGRGFRACRARLSVVARR